MTAREQCLKTLIAAVLNFDEAEVRRVVEDAIEAHVAPSELIDEGLIPAIRELGEMFGRGEVFLPHMIMASEIVEDAIQLIEPHFPKGEERVPIRIVIGTVEGDLHDLGKNVVMMMLKANGFDVYDVGRDVKAETFIQRAKELGAQIIAASSLMSTTMPYQREIVEELDRQGLREKIKIIVGGGPCHLEWAKSIGADGYGNDGAEAVQEVRRLLRLGE